MSDSAARRERAPVSKQTAVQAILAERRTKSPFGGRTSVAPVQRQEAMLIDLAYYSNCGARL